MSGRDYALSAAERLRTESVERLGETAAGVPALLELLADPSWAVRREVVAALGHLGDAAVPLLCDLLRTWREDETRLAAAVDALSSSTSALVDDAVIALAASPDPAIVADAAQILGRRRSVAAIPTLAALTVAADDNVAVASIEALGRFDGSAGIDPLIAAAASGNFFRALPAIDVLGRSGDPRVVAPIAALLGDPRYTHTAARALGRTGEKGAAPPLMKLLAHPSDRVVRVIATALAELHDRHVERYGVSTTLDRALTDAASPVAVRRLIKAAVGADPVEQTAICRALGVLGDDSALPFLTRLLDGPAPVATAAAEVLKKLGRKADLQLLEALHDGDSARRRLLLPLVTARSSATAEILRCLDDPDPGVRAAACTALARVGNPSVAPQLFALLADPNPRVVQVAVGAIESLGSAETEALTLEAARSSAPQVRRAAFRIVACLGYASALDVLVETIAGDDERLREGAIHALPFLDVPGAATALFAAARLPDARSRAAAMRALGERRGEPEVVAVLLSGLSDPGPWVRYYACQSLGKLAWEPAAEAIAALLGDEAGQTRAAAVEALSHMRGDVAFDALREAADGGDPDMKRAALLGLGLGQRPEALPILLAASSEHDPATRLVAVSALASLDAPEVVPALARAAADADDGVRTAAIGFLAGRTGEAATAALIALLRSGAPGERVLGALSVPSDARIAGLLAALADADDDLAPRLTSALARMRHPGAVEAIASALSLSNVAARKAGVATLGVLGTPEAIDALRRAAAIDPDPEVRRRCALELSQ